MGISSLKTREWFSWGTPLGVAGRKLLDRLTDLSNKTFLAKLLHMLPNNLLIPDFGVEIQYGLTNVLCRRFPNKILIIRKSFGKVKNDGTLLQQIL